MKSLVEVIAGTVEQVRRMRPPCSRNPHAFHEDKGELVGALSELAELAREHP